MSNIAKALLDIRAVVINSEEPFTWSSGLISPIYVDNRLINSFPSERKIIEESLAKLVEEKFPNTEAIIGTATAGISHAAYISSILNLPMAYVRSQSKDHGKKNQVEGHVPRGQRVVVVEDLLSTGGSVLKAIDALKQHGANVLGVVAISSYQLPQLHKNMKDIQYYTLTNIYEILKEGNVNGSINNAEVLIVKNFLREWGDR